MSGEAYEDPRVSYFRLYVQTIFNTGWIPEHVPLVLDTLLRKIIEKAGAKYGDLYIHPGTIPKEKLGNYIRVEGNQRAGLHLPTSIKFDAGILEPGAGTSLQTVLKVGEKLQFEVNGNKYQAHIVKWKHQSGGFRTEYEYEIDITSEGFRWPDYVGLPANPALMLVLKDVPANHKNHNFFGAIFHQTNPPHSISSTSQSLNAHSNAVADKTRKGLRRQDQAQRNRRRGKNRGGHSQQRYQRYPLARPSHPTTGSTARRSLQSVNVLNGTANMSELASSYREYHRRSAAAGRRALEEAGAWY